MADYDLAIIGGGINGAGIARDAAGRGLRVLLLEQNDLGSGTSSASTKLIHGGLRYLEHGAFRLVREALTEREVLLRMAPHLIRPMRFVLPAVPGPRSPFMLRLGLFLYDCLGARKILPAARSVDLTHHVTGQPLLRKFRYGFEYSDCWVDDARLVVLNALDAAERGADDPHPHPRRPRRARGRLAADPECAGPARGRDAPACWSMPPGPGSASCRRPCCASRGRRRCGWSRAATSWCASCSTTTAATSSRTPTSASCSPCRSRSDFTLIGTTDMNFAGALDARRAERRRDRLSVPRGERVISASRSSPEQVVWAFAGVRSLYDDEQGQGQAEDVTRDYHLELDERYGAAPLLTVYGGKITTYRRLAEDALGKLVAFLPVAPALDRDDAAAGRRLSLGWRSRRSVAQTLRAWPFLGEAEAWRLVRAYGTRVERVSATPRQRDDLGPCFGAAQRGRGALPDDSTNGRGQPTTCCGGAPSSGCSSTPANRKRWRISWRKAASAAAVSSR